MFVDLSSLGYSRAIPQARASGALHADSKATAVINKVSPKIAGGKKEIVL